MRIESLFTNFQQHLAGATLVGHLASEDFGERGIRGGPLHAEVRCQVGRNTQLVVPCGFGVGWDRIGFPRAR